MQNQNRVMSICPQSSCLLLSFHPNLQETTGHQLQAFQLLCDWNENKHYVSWQLYLLLFNKEKKHVNTFRPCSKQPSILSSAYKKYMRCLEESSHLPQKHLLWETSPILYEHIDDVQGVQDLDSIRTHLIPITTFTEQIVSLDKKYLEH